LTLLVCAQPSTKQVTPVFLPIIAKANASTKSEKRRHRDPYALAQAKQRKLANLSRQEVLKKEREASLGDPVRGIPTPFVESFNSATPIPGVDKETTPHLNFFLKPQELETALQHSYILTQPIISTNRDVQDPAQEAADIKNHADDHERAAAAVQRIVSLSIGNQKDRTRVNIQRCIDAFGRHNTDAILKPRAPAVASANQPTKTPRAGPDTGSSEVQVAILTAKIKVLADHMLLKGRQKDKINKRNLRVLVHKRQKHLQYLRRKERGGERWLNLIQTLGLTEGTWKGEISL
jgi:ribosomal protein S15